MNSITIVITMMITIARKAALRRKVPRLAAVSRGDVEVVDL